jgi:ParB-like chromosome segregation protein Spo0J
MKDPITESRLEREGVSYTFQAGLPLTAIDVQAGLRNQARLESPLDKQTVERYALAMIDGAQFPPVLLVAQPSGLYLPVDGNHRLAGASEAELPAVDAYVLDVHDKLVITRLIRTWNIGNGRQPSREDIIEQGLYLANNTPYSHKDIARMLGMKEGTFSAYVRARAVKERLFGISIPADAIPHATLNRLHQLKDDSVLGEVAKLTIRAGLSLDRIDGLLADLAKQRTEADRLAVVKSWWTLTKERQANTGGGRFTSVTKRDKVSKLLQAMRTVSELIGRNPVAAQFGLLSSDDLTAVQGGYTEMVNRVRRLLDSAGPISQRMAS